MVPHDVNEPQSINFPECPEIVPYEYFLNNVRFICVLVLVLSYVVVILSVLVDSGHNQERVNASDTR